MLSLNCILCISPAELLLARCLSTSVLLAMDCNILPVWRSRMCKAFSGYDAVKRYGNYTFMHRIPEVCSVKFAIRRARCRFHIFTVLSIDPDTTVTWLMFSRQFIALECPRSILHSSLDQIRRVLSTDADAYPPSQCTALVVQFPCPWNVCHFLLPTFHCLTVLSRDVLSILSPQILMSIIISLCPSRIHV